MKAILAGLVLMAPAAASATPIVYLDCQLPSPQGPKVARIAMDEDRKEVIYRLPAQKTAKRLLATFTTRDVTFSVDDSEGEITFSINRFDLSVQRYKRIGIEKSAVTSGSCTTTTAP